MIEALSIYIKQKIPLLADLMLFVGSDNTVGCEA